MSTTLPLLLEIGVEELPSSFVDGALTALPKIVADELAKARLTHGVMEAFGTPRRLAVLVHDVATRQSDLDEEVIGPPETAAFQNGKPTKAAEAFAGKLGVSVTSLKLVKKAAASKQKGGRYVVGRRLEKGRTAMDLLGGALVAVCAAVPFPKTMRWGDSDVLFGRPVHWIVALLGQEIVPMSFGGIVSARISRGHRFLAPDTFEISGPDAYLAALRQRHVLGSKAERAQTMVDRLRAAADALGGDYDPDPRLIDENASLVEEPHVITGSFDRAALELPPMVIRAVARGHQKYFCIQRSEEDLLPSYLAVVNTANRPDLIAKGTDRVMCARLADARFFWREDQRLRLEDRMERLSGIVFHHRLGTVREKVDRVVHLADDIARALGIDDARGASIQRAARLCKCDLVTLMVSELPELEGHMGRAYALAQGEPAQVADAIRDHYKPVGAQDDVAPDDVSAVVALADRFDTLAGCFAVGLSPTGAADPFALRRACIGALRTMIERGYASLAVADLVALAYARLKDKKLDLSFGECVAKVDEFATERLRGLIAVDTGGAVADAVIASSRSAARRSVVADWTRARVLHSLVIGGEPWLAKAKVVAKRLSGISREAQPKFHDAAAFSESSKRDDLAIVKLVKELDEATRSLSTQESVRAALMNMEHVAVELDRIFIETLVNDPDDPCTHARLETLAFGAQAILRLADFSRLA